MAPAIGSTPKVIVAEKGGEPIQFAEALGDLANGILVGAYWDPIVRLPRCCRPFSDRFRGRNRADVEPAHRRQLHGSDGAHGRHLGGPDRSDKDAINDAIGKTDKEYAVGPVEFDDHVSVLGLACVQWQSGKTVVVWPSNRTTGSLLFPVPKS